MLATRKSFVIVSYNKKDEIKELYNDFFIFEVDRPNSMSKKKEDRYEEYIMTNYDPSMRDVIPSIHQATNPCFATTEEQLHKLLELLDGIATLSLVASMWDMRISTTLRLSSKLTDSQSLR